LPRRGAAGELETAGAGDAVSEGEGEARPFLEPSLGEGEPCWVVLDVLPSAISRTETPAATTRVASTNSHAAGTRGGLR